MNRNFLSLCLLSTSIFVSFLSPVAAYSPEYGCFDPSACCYNPCCGHLYLQLETGFSKSRRADISVDLHVWDSAEQGYNDDLGNSEFYGARLGYLFNTFIGADISVVRRPDFEYEKFQSPVGTGTPGFLGDKTRFFDFNNTSIMLDVTFYGKGLANCFAFNISRCAYIQPFIGGGVGIAYNTVEDFHSVLGRDPRAFLADVSSIMAPETRSSFAWQLFGGLEFVSGHWGTGIGYRYFDGGKFESNDYLISIPIGQDTTTKAPPWHGEFRTNEGFFFIRYAI